MSGAVLRTQLGAAARRPARMLLTGLAVFVVSFVVYATVLTQHITRNTLINQLSSTPAAADVVVRDGDVGTGTLDAVRAIPGVAEAVGLIEAGGVFGQDYLDLAADPGSGPLALTSVTSGRYPSKPGEIAITARTGERLGLHVGSTFPLRIHDERKPATLTVVGTVTSRADWGQNAYAPQTTVSALLGEKGLEQIQVRLAPGADPAAVRSRIASAATGSKVLDGADVRHDEAEAKASNLDAVFAVVAMFVAIAVVAAALVATSTFRIVFAQRMRQLALLRAIGAGRGAISASLAAEGALTGLVTGLGGASLALLIGEVVPPILRASGKHVTGPGFPALAFAGTVLLAIVLTTFAVLAPAFSASRVAPLEALRSASSTSGRRGIGVLRWVFGVLLLITAGSLAFYVYGNLPGRDPMNYDAQSNLFATVGSGALAFFGLVALGPSIVRPVLALTGWPLRRSGPVGRLAAGGVGAAPRRAAAVSVVVALGVMLTAGVLIGGASLRVLIGREAALSAPADFELATTPAATAPLTDAIVRKAQASPDLAHVTPYRRLPVKTGDFDGQAVDLDMSALPELGHLDAAQGDLSDHGPGTVILAGYIADSAGTKVGDTVVLKGQRLRVSAVLPDAAPLQATWIVDPSDLTKMGAPAGTYSGVLADAAHDGETGRTAGRKALLDTAPDGSFSVAVLADSRDEIESSLTLVIVIALGLIGLTVLIAVVGVGTTTALSVVERVRESGLLRAVGLSKAGLRVMLTTEAALYGVIGGVLGIVLGIPYAWLAVSALGVQAPLTLPYGQLAAVFVILVLFTALAGVLPARRAAKVSPVVALGTE